MKVRGKVKSFYSICRCIAAVLQRFTGWLRGGGEKCAETEVWEAKQEMEVGNQEEKLSDNQAMQYSAY